MDLPPLTLDRKADRPLAVQLANALRSATTSGVLRAGERLPSTRALAVTLGVSRTVTAAAYEQLLAEGWVRGQPGAGTFVLGPPSGTAPAGSPAPARPDPVDRPASPNPASLELRAGVPCLEVIDRAAWRRAWRAAADPPRTPARTRWAGGRSGRWQRRCCGTAGWRSARPRCWPQQAARRRSPSWPAPCRAGPVAVEEPGYPRAVAALTQTGMVVHPTPVDSAGLVVEALPAGLAAVYCTPARQFPLDARLSAARRVALVERARADGFLVVEDDYDGELRYDVAPLPPLAALGPDVVVHLGTASKLLTPTLGAGWLVGPPRVRRAVLELRERTGSRPARAGQRVFAALAFHGDLARHLRRLSRELAGRRAAVLAAVTCAGGRVRGDAAGAHVMVPLPDEATEQAVRSAAGRGGVALDGLARHFTGLPTEAGLLLGYAGLPRAAFDRALPVVTKAVGEVSPPAAG